MRLINFPPYMTLPNHLLSCCILLTGFDTLGVRLARADTPPAVPSPDFARDIRPILSANCFACHGPDAEARKAKLRLDSFADATRAAIVPGHPERSELIARINHPDPDKRMPPADSGHSLAENQKHRLEAWIRQGAHYTEHWAFIPPTRPALPEKFRDSKLHPIDTFVRARLTTQNLKPSPRADPYTLIRRLSLDLTGLPPTPEQADAFARDPTPAATEALVDKLLDSPHFGEHWARTWLDLARYADTKGYEKDQPRQIWRYRDWVIDAFNRDLPYDEFTRQQLAGDLLPNPSVEQQLATAFHRNTMTNDEGGTDNEEFRVAAVKDRVDTTMQIWMGLTMSCAKCHSHKYDPIDIREYYEFYAIFNQTEDADRSDDAPRLAVPSSETQRAIADAKAALQAAETELKQARPDWQADFENWKKNPLEAAAAWQILTPENPVAGQGTKLTQQDDGSLLASGPHPNTNIYRLGLTLPVGTTTLRLEALTHPSMHRNGPGRLGSDPNYVVSEFELRDAQGKKIFLKNARADFSQKNWPAANSIDSRLETGWAISPQAGKPHALIVELSTPHSGPVKLKLKQNYQKLQMGCFRISASHLPFGQLKPDIAPSAAQLEEAFLTEHPPARAIKERIDSARRKLEGLNKNQPTVPVMRDLPADRRRITKIHHRGNFLNQTDEVAPALPRAFGSWQPEKPNRLDAANWLMHPENQLTARVAVNRIWARLFGTGLVETEEDFGTQGTLPTHPDLLDWLAVEFRDTGWSQKQLIKRIVLSATYQQSAHRTEGHTADMLNRWLARGPRFRLSAESVRDQALAISGLLHPKIGGPSVMPPQPDGVWKSTYNASTWKTAEGPDRYRRGLYTFWKRTSPHPAMLTFDAGSREVCQIRRIRTNTPLAALVTLNDPAHIEAAGALARRMVKEGREGPLQRGFRLALIRPPDAAELERLEQLYDSLLERFTASPESAKELATSARAEDRTPAFAAWVAVANVLLNLDETLTKP